MVSSPGTITSLVCLFLVEASLDCSLYIKSILEQSLTPTASGHHECLLHDLCIFHLGLFNFFFCAHLINAICFVLGGLFYKTVQFKRSKSRVCLNPWDLPQCLALGVCACILNVHVHG